MRQVWGMMVMAGMLGALASCKKEERQEAAPPPPAAAAQDAPAAPKPPKPYRAQGNEPFWHAEIAGGVLSFTLADGGQVLSRPVSTDEERYGMRVVTARDMETEIAMMIRYVTCHDDMSGEHFAHRVTVHYGGRDYTGCGRSMIRDITWVLESMNKETLAEDSRVTMTLGREAKAQGYTGCNAFEADYTLEGATVAIGPQVKAGGGKCTIPALRAQEEKFMALLPRMTMAVIDDYGLLVLSNADGESLRFYGGE